MSVEAWKPLFDVATVALLFLHLLLAGECLSLGVSSTADKSERFRSFPMHEYGVRCEGE